MDVSALPARLACIHPTDPNRSTQNPHPHITHTLTPPNPTSHVLTKYTTQNKPHHITNHPNSYLAHVQQNVPENKVSVAPYIEKEVKPLMRGDDLIVTSAEDDEEEGGK